MASYTFPAAIQIADSRLYAGQPLTEDLMMDLRDRDQDAADTGLENRSLQIGGKAYDAVAAAFLYWFDAYRNIITGGGLTDLTQDMRIYVPPGVTSVAVNIYASAAASAASVRVYGYINGVSAMWDNLPLGAGSEAWMTEKSIAPGATGWLDFQFKGYNTSGVNREVRVRGFTVRFE